MSSTAKAKTAKLSMLHLYSNHKPLSDSDLVRTLLDYFNAIPESQAIQMKTLTDNIAWTKAEKRIFLKHSLETRLVGLCVTSFHPSLDLPTYEIQTGS
jgi:26S proteasome regulatory subunit N6